MKIVFLSNFFNHHQKELCDELYKLSGHDFLFVETSPMPQERIELGYKIEKPIYVKAMHEFNSDTSSILDEINRADFVICGSAPEKLLKDRKRNKKVIFRYSERPLKLGNSKLKYVYRYILWHLQNPKNCPIYMLCASAYTAGDYLKFGLYRAKTYKWGYFPPVEKIEVEKIEKEWNKIETIKMIWVGRIESFKHPEMISKLAEGLKKENYKFEIKVIGIGSLKLKLEEEIKIKGLENNVKFVGAVPYQEVREHMKGADIFLFTSDYREGWGAVLNEAMNSCCACVVSHAAGSTPYLISHKKNGLVYQHGDFDDFYSKVRLLCESPDLIKKYAHSAYKTIVNEWNGKIAAKRLIELHDMLSLHREIGFCEGPCSFAKPIGERDMYKYCIDSNREEND